MEDLVIFNIIYFLIAFFLVFPPDELQSVGLTIPNLFSSYLGNEHSDFVHFHLKRINLTLIIHSLIPFGYYLFIGFYLPRLNLFDFAQLDALSKSYLSLSVCLAIAASTLVYYWTLNDYSNNPILKKLKSIAANGSDWKEQIKSINSEIKNVDKFSSGSLFNRIYVTDTWLLKVNLYSLNICQHKDYEFILTHSKEFELMHERNPCSQLLNILVKPAASQQQTQERPRRQLEQFYIRLNSFEYKDFKEKLDRPIQKACDIIIKQSLPDQFLEVFCEHVFSNPSYKLKRDEIDNCVGCFRRQANIKLVKRCIAGENESERERCLTCNCRPMWCIECLGKWFAHKQDQSEPQKWLSSKSECATCRAVFCILDVAPIEPID